MGPPFSSLITRGGSMELAASLTACWLRLLRSGLCRRHGCRPASFSRRVPLWLCIGVRHILSPPPPGVSSVGRPQRVGPIHPHTTIPNPPPETFTWSAGAWDPDNFLPWGPYLAPVVIDTVCR